MTITCPLTNQTEEKVLLAHGSGGSLTAKLIDNIFLPAFGSSADVLHDGAFLKIGSQELAFTTDSYVVRPLFFPGGNIGDLAVYGTVNDLAMCGARPLYLSCAFILEEGFEIDRLKQIVCSMKSAADAAKVKLVTGDTKVIENARGDSVYINTSGVGIIEKQKMAPQNIRAGDLILVSGDIGRHGTAVMSVREGLTFESEIESDTCELSSTVQALLQEAVEIHCLRDLTRGGLATALVELAEASGLGFDIDEGSVPVDGAVRGACEFLGLDPFYVACEGRMIAFTASGDADRALDMMKSCGQLPKIIGSVTQDHPSQVTAKTFIGTKRILDRLSGDQLPRIC